MCPGVFSSEACEQASRGLMQTSPAPPPGTAASYFGASRHPTPSGLATVLEKFYHEARAGLSTTLERVLGP